MPADPDQKADTSGYWANPPHHERLGERLMPFVKLSLAEAGDLDGRISQLFLPGNLLRMMVVAGTPISSVLIVAVEISVAQL